MRLNSVWIAGAALPTNTPMFVKACYEGILPYLRDFLSAPHPFRKGIMCPFVPKALKQAQIFFTYCDMDLSDKQFKLYIKACCEHYKQRVPSRKAFGALIILFPEKFSIEKLLTIHVDTKSICVKNALMLGALWPTNKASSLHAEDYFPLRTPSPILVIRDLTLSDFIFMAPAHYNLSTRLSFLNTFINTFRAEKKQVVVAKALRRKYRCKRIVIHCLWVMPILAIILFFRL